MLSFAPILLGLIYAVVMTYASARRQRQEIESNSTELLDPRLLAVCRNLAQALEIERVRVYLFETPSINGFASENGRIYLTRGFYNRYRSGAVTAEELGGVIAHEIGHIALGHTRNRVLGATGQTALRALLARAFGRVLPGVGSTVANGATTLLEKRLSRGAEFEADEFAAELLLKAGYGVTPLITMFRKLDGLGQTPRAQPPAWLSSHPRTSDRIKALEAFKARYA